MPRQDRYPVDVSTGWELEDLWGYVAQPSTGLADFETVAREVSSCGLTTLGQWGGNWALRARHRSTGTLALATDACATVPMYWLRAGGRIHADPNLETLTSHIRRLQPDAEYIADALVHKGKEDGTVFYGVNAVPAGSITLIRTDGSWHTTRYFRPEDIRQRRIDPDAAVDLLADTIDEAVADAVTGQRVATHVSGGMDSGVVTAMAMRHAPIVASYTWTPPAAADHPTAEDRRVRITAEALGLTPEYSDPNSTDGTWARTVDPVIYPRWGYLAYEAVTLPRAAAAGATTILSGWGGDDFASSPMSRADLFLASGQWRRWWQHAQARAEATGSATWRQTGILSIGRPRRPPRFAWTTGRARAWRQRFPTLRSATWWLAASRFGLSYRYPLLDPRVIRLASSLPVTCFAYEGQTRWAFRQVAARLLPAEALAGDLKSEPERIRLLLEDRQQQRHVQRVAETYPDLAKIYLDWLAESELRTLVL